MLFNSHVFIFCFLPITLLVFFILGRQQRAEAAMAWLVTASLFFYAWWEPIYIFLILSSILVNFFIGKTISSHGNLTSRRIWMVIGVCFNLGLLLYFKYTNFLVESFNMLAGSSITVTRIILPLAISFFTFQQIAYLVDAYRDETRESNFIHYSLFVCFFPQLIAGPIVHHREMLSQFKQKETFTPKATHFAIGLTIFSIGLFKKVVLADGVAHYATPVFSAADGGVTLHFIDAWGGTLAYTLQLYFDFSGYSDMAIGLARLFGIKLPLNFQSPYKAASIIDFWRRWHLTLTRFLRDYLYFALGGNRFGKLKQLRNIMLTMLLGGMWHGAGWNYAVFGLLHGFYIIINHGWRSIPHKLKPTLIHPRVNHIMSVAVTLYFFMISLVIFRTETFQGALNMMGPMLDITQMTQHVSSGISFMDKDAIKWFIILLSIVWFAPNTQEIMRRYEPAIDAAYHITTGTWNEKIVWQPNGGWAAYTAVLAVIAVFSLTRVSEFLYFQF